MLLLLVTVQVTMKSEPAHWTVEFEVTVVVREMGVFLVMETLDPDPSVTETTGAQGLSNS
jgi:hypothetical protein